jgi:glycosyltransferase involved in cell wall biosynthesis
VKLDLTARHAPLVSIVTPTFNASRWIERCILSVRDQDYPKLEHIIVDGGSTDETLEICARYPHLVVHSAPDRGQSDALNRGFAMARGEVLAWLCADDEYMPGALSTAVDFVMAGNDFVVGNCQFIDAEGRTIAAHPANVRHHIDHQTVLRFWRVTLPQPAAFWRRRLWERCGPLREDLHFTMDYDLWLRMTRVTPVERVGVDVAAYRIHPDAKCFADNYGSRLELLQVSRSYWPPSWHPGHWRLAFEHWFSGRDITRHYTDAERLRERAFHKLRERRRLEAFVAFAKMHAVHPRSPSMPDYRRLVRKLAGSVVPVFLVPLAQAALKRWRRADRVAA